MDDLGIALLILLIAACIIAYRRQSA